MSEVMARQVVAMDPEQVSSLNEQVDRLGRRALHGGPGGRSGVCACHEGTSPDSHPVVAQEPGNDDPRLRGLSARDV